MIFDMHTHTTYSDGLINPRELVDLGIKSGLDGIALTDHDEVRGIKEAIEQSRKYPNFHIIPGIEFGCNMNNEEVHILGYFIDYENKDLLEILNKLHESRYTRAHLILLKLKKLGIDIHMEDILKRSDKENLGRPHIGRAMIDKGYVDNLEEAFEKYLDRGKPAYVERYQLTIEDTIELISRLNGISILAHPGLLKDREIIDYCIGKGIMGLEVYHSKHNRSNEEEYIKIAQAKNLIITGGSDFHGDRGVLGNPSVDIDYIPEIKRRLLDV